MSSNRKTTLQEESSAINFLESVRVSFMNQPMCKLGDFLITLKCRLLNIQRHVWNKPEFEDYQQWFNEGYSAEILEVGGSGWKKGRVKINISIEFIPDEPEEIVLESPLDDIRQSMPKN